MTTTIHSVREGESPQSIARMHGVSPAALARANMHRFGMDGGDSAFAVALFVGEELFIPTPSSTPLERRIGRMEQRRGTMGDASAVVGGVSWAWDQTKKTPVGQIDDQLARWFTSDPSTWTTGTEKVAVATIISSMAVLAGSGFPLVLVPFLMPLVAAVADVVVDDIGGFLGLARGTYCDHPEWRTQKMDDPLWIHYPDRLGIPAKGHESFKDGYQYGGVQHAGWGKLGLPSLTPDVRDYPWIEALATGIGPDLPSLVVLKIPAAQPGSFFDFWYRVYAKVKETNALQDCIRRSPEDADKQDEAALTAFVAIWNGKHKASPNDATFPGGAAAGDDLLLAKHASPITIHMGAAIPPAATSAPRASSSTSSGAGAAVATGGVIAAAAGAFWIALSKSAAAAAARHTISRTFARKKKR